MIPLVALPRYSPYYVNPARRSGEIGIRTRLKIWRGSLLMSVRVRPPAPSASQGHTLRCPPLFCQLSPSLADHERYEALFKRTTLLVLSAESFEIGWQRFDKLQSPSKLLDLGPFKLISSRSNCFSVSFILTDRERLLPISAP